MSDQETLFRRTVVFVQESHAAASSSAWIVLGLSIVGALILAVFVGNWIKKGRLLKLTLSSLTLHHQKVLIGPSAKQKTD